jgi:uncharacterized SAM-binding protein YcdF (DUF218 family)
VADLSLRALPIALLVPPFNLVPASIAGLLIVRWHRRTGFLIVALGLGGLWLLATPIVAEWLIFSLERDLPLIPPGNTPPGAIVILSAEMRHSFGSVDAIPGPLTLERERAGAALARRTNLPILVTGGDLDDDPESLAAVMARSLASDFNTPVRWIEPNSVDTWANAANSATILRAQHIHSIYLVTHAWHMRRALLAFARTDIAVTAAPVWLDPVPVGKWSDFVPTASAWLTSYYALHEWLGCAYYAWLR